MTHLGEHEAASKVASIIVSATLFVAPWLFVRMFWTGVDRVVAVLAVAAWVLRFASQTETPPATAEAAPTDYPPIDDVVDYVRYTLPSLDPEHFRIVAEGARGVADSWVAQGISPDHPSVVAALFLEDECLQRAAAEAEFRSAYSPSAQLLAFMQGLPSAN